MSMTFPRSRPSLWWPMLLALACAARTIPAQIIIHDVFTGGGESGGTSNYRIPGLVVAADGSLVAFAEGRRNGGDPGAAGYPIDMTFKRSTDGGVTWSPLGLIARDARFDYSDPVPILDRSTGNIDLLFLRWPDAAGLSKVPAGTGTNSLNILRTTSIDNGASWSLIEDITTQVKNPTWKGVVLGPGSGIQLRWQTDPARNGRLVAPAHLEGVSNFAVFSDDHGETWASGGLAQPAVGGVNANESEIVETVDGDLLLNARQNAGTTRQMFRSSDGGATWQQAFSGPSPVTTVDASMIRFTAVRDGDDRNRIVFSAPTGSTLGSGNSRHNLTVWTSYDEGRSFINPVQIVSGFSAYSVLAKQADGRLGAIYEATGTTLIRYASFGLETLEPQPHSTALTHYDGFSNTLDQSAGGIGWSGKWTGTGTITTATSAAFDGGSSVVFGGSAVPSEPGRIDLVAGQSSRRTLATPIDLGTSGTTYLSMFVSRILDTSANDASQEFLDVLLQDAGNATQAAFGVGSAENIYVTSLGDVVTTGGGAFDLTRSCLLLAKIMATSTGTADRILLKAFRAGVDSVPVTDDGLDWTVMGTTTENSSAVLTQLVLSGGSKATWSVDEVRIGTMYAAVTPGFSAITIRVASGTQTPTQAGYPTLSEAIPVVKTGDRTLALDQTNPVSGPITVQSGRLLLAHGAAAALARIAPEAGGTLALAPGLRAGIDRLEIGAGGLVDVGSGLLTVAGGLSAADTIAAIVAGRGDGTWDGGRGIVSRAAAESPGARTVGWMPGDDGSITIAYAAPGDANLDWQIDVLDAASFLAADTFDTGRPATWATGDFDYDGLVDILDAATFISTGLFDTGLYNHAPGLAAMAVPEPMAVHHVIAAMLAAGSLAIMRPRHRR